MRTTAVALILSFSAAPLFANDYTSMQQRPIKAMSEEQIRAHREGAGMGLALAAELNGHPGPKHILELADRLALTAGQRQQVESVHSRMKNEAARLGNEIVDLEARLDEVFRTATVDERQLEQLTGKIAAAQGRLRYAHLVAHLESRALLSAEQRASYARLRGYTADRSAHHGHAHHH